MKLDYIHMPDASTLDTCLQTLKQQVSTSNEEDLEELSGTGSANSDPKDTKEEENETPDQEKEEQLKELQRQSTATRNEDLQTEELIDNYDYYEGASW